MSEAGERTGPARRRPADSRTELAELVMPQHANILGKVFGGTILSLVDKAAACAAIRHAGRTCVTAQVDQVAFLAPIEIGELVRLVATVTWVGRSSMEVGVDVHAMDIRAGTQRLTNTCYVTMVAIDEAGRPAPVPELSLETEAERALFAAGAERARARREMRRS